MIYLLRSPTAFCLFMLFKKRKQIYIYAVNACNQWQDNQVQMCAARYEVHQSMIINLTRWNGSEGARFKTNVNLKCLNPL